MGNHLITGGSGFVGSFIAKKLIKRGEQVCIVDIIDSPTRDPLTTFKKVDVTVYAEIEKVMKDVDYVHHTAALVPLRKAGNLFWRVNVEGTKNTLLAAQRAGVKHFSHISSSAVFGKIKKSDCPITDSTPTSPIETYGRSKLAGENLVLEYMNQSTRMSCSIIRPRTIIGTERLGIFQILFEWISEGRNIYIIGNGKNIFQFVHAGDLAETSVLSALSKKQGIFNVGTDRYGTLRECLESLCRYAGTGSKVISIPVKFSMAALWLLDKCALSPLGPWHYLTYHKDFYFDISKAEKELHWKAQFSNDEMMKEAYNWYLTNREGINTLSTQSVGSAHKNPLKQGILSLIKRLS